MHRLTLNIGISGMTEAHFTNASADLVRIAAASIQNGGLVGAIHYGTDKVGGWSIINLPDERKEVSCHSNTPSANSCDSSETPPPASVGGSQSAEEHT